MASTSITKPVVGIFMTHTLMFCKTSINPLHSIAVYCPIQLVDVLLKCPTQPPKNALIGSVG
jgi:hypothetical protein